MSSNAEIRITGVRLNAGSDLMFSMTCKPFNPGMIRSSSTKSNAQQRSWSSAC